jgi:hypothetical protein
LRGTASTIGLFVLAPAAVAFALAFGPDPVRIGASRPLIAREADYQGSDACRACHPDQHESWARTYHRTMTQLPSETSVVGRFDGRPVEFYGERVAEVALCVGSHRYQQYFELAGAEVGGTYRPPAASASPRSRCASARTATSSTSSSPVPKSAAPTGACRSCGTSASSAGCT